MPRYKYVCPKCGNEVPAERMEKRVPGTRGMTRVFLPVFCESAAHAGPEQMDREETTPQRREVSSR